MSRGRRHKRLSVWWGSVVLLAMVIGFGLSVGVLPYVAMTGLILIWTLVAAPLSCGAINRRRGRAVEYCRNNSSGLLFGCHVRQHKYQRFAHAWWQTSWRDRTRGIWAGARAKLATVTGIGGLALGVAGIIQNAA